jgi:hypothetical protein
MSELDMQSELERLRAENVQLKSKDKGGLTLKVSEKGGSPYTAWAAFRSRFTRNNGSVSWQARRRSRRSSVKTTPS